MSAVVYPTKVFHYFNNIVDQDKVKQLHSFCIAGSICHVVALVIDHCNDYQCFCFKCRIYRLLIKVLFSIGHGRLLYIVEKSNYLTITNDCIYMQIFIPTQKSFKKNEYLNLDFLDNKISERHDCGSMACQGHDVALNLYVSRAW